MIYFTSYTAWPHPALMSSSLEDRLIPVGRDRFILTHCNIRQQVCPALNLAQKSGQVFSLEISRQNSNYDGIEI